MKTDKKVLDYAKARKLADKLHHESKMISFTSGCYDLLHLGHILHLNYCRSKGDVLIVSVGNDETVRKLKGPGRPLLPAKVRARLLASLELVDYVIISEEVGKMDHSRLIEILKPAVYIVNATDSHVEEKRLLAQSNGAKLVLAKRMPPSGAAGISTTSLIEKINRL